MRRHTVALLAMAFCAVFGTTACSAPGGTVKVGVAAFSQRAGVSEEAIEGEKALTFDKKDGAVSGRADFPAGVTEFWIRARFPWIGGSDALEVSVDGKSLGKVTARNVDGLWDNGDFQV